MKFQAINYLTNEIVEGVGYTPTTSVYNLADGNLSNKPLGYLFTGPNTEWADMCEFTVHDKFYIVYDDSVKVINN